MDFSDESYVRLYTRRTMNSRLIGWEGRAVLHELMHDLDRAGVLEIEDVEPAEAVSIITGLPLEVARVGLEKCIERKVLEVHGNHIVWPNWVDGQTAPRSDKARQSESRARRRDLKRAQSAGLVEVKRDSTELDSGPTSTVTNRDAPVTNRDNGSRDVTERHDTPDPPSQPVTPSLEEPNLADADRARGGAGGKVPCPPDLWAQMPEETKASLDVEMVPRWAQERLCARFVGNHAGDAEDEWRTVSQWIRSATSAIRGDWRDPKRRPSKTAAADSGDDEDAHMARMFQA